MLNYKSDGSRLARLFRKSRDLWKDRSNRKQKQLKLKENTIRDLKISRDNWKNKSKSYKKKLDEVSKELEVQKKTRFDGELAIEKSLETCAVNHSFPLAIVHLSILSFTNNGVSFRGTSNTFDLFSRYYHNEIPSYSTVRKWVFRTGLYSLNTSVKTTGDMTWILDHSIEMGGEKLLLAIGISNQAMTEKNRFVPNFDDVMLLDLDVSAQSNGDSVYRKLEELEDRYGSPAQILIDGGSDLVKGTRLFREDRPQVVHTYDLMHKIAALLKGELHPDDAWNEFLEATAMTGKMVRQTNFLYAAPPSMRTKARYMNAELYIDWANKVSHYINQGDFSLTSDSYELNEWILEEFNGDLALNEALGATALFGHPFANKARFASELRRVIGDKAFKRCGDKIINRSCTGRIPFEMKFDWINDFERELKEFTQLMWVVEAAKKEVRQNGLNVQSVESFNNRFNPDIRLTERANLFKEKVADAIREESSEVPSGVSLLGSSEIIESVFGKYKTFSSKRPIKTVGEMILTIPLLLTRITTDVIKRALETTSYKSVESWSEKTFGKSTLSKRISAFGKKTQFQDEVFSLSTV